MDAMSAADSRPNVILPISHEIQAYCYRHVLKIIKEKGCRYQEAWDIFRGQMEKRLNENEIADNGRKLARMIIEEVDKRNQ